MSLVGLNALTSGRIKRRGVVGTAMNCAKIVLRESH